MKFFITILSFLLTISASAQQDLTLHVKKLPTLTISPDSLYFTSHTARSFRIHQLPAGTRLWAEFTGGDLSIHDSTITLTPFYVYRDTDVSRLQSPSITGYKTTKGSFFMAELHLTAIDAGGTVRARADRPCYIRPQGPPRNVPFTSSSFDGTLLKALEADSAISR